MNHKIEIKHNRPSVAGRGNDPDLRDDSALQPGVSTISSSDTDEVNDSLTETASDDFAEDKFGEGADEAFDEVAKDDSE